MLLSIGFPSAARVGNKVCMEYTGTGCTTPTQLQGGPVHAPPPYAPYLCCDCYVRAGESLKLR